MSKITFFPKRAIRPSENLFRKSHRVSFMEAKELNHWEVRHAKNRIEWTRELYVLSPRHHGASLYKSTESLLLRKEKFVGKHASESYWNIISATCKKQRVREGSMRQAPLEYITFSKVTQTRRFFDFIPCLQALPSAMPLELLCAKYKSCPHNGTCKTSQ